MRKPRIGIRAFCVFQKAEIEIHFVSFSHLLRPKYCPSHTTELERIIKGTVYDG